MKNPWVHDDVPDGRSIYKSRAKLIGAALWGLLLLLVGGVLLFAGPDTMIATGPRVSTGITAVLATVALLISLPLVLKLLAVSRLVGTLALLGTWSIIGRFVLERERDAFAEIDSVETVRERGAETLEPLAELAEILEEFPEVFEDLPTSSAVIFEWTILLLDSRLMLL